MRYCIIENGTHITKMPYILVITFAVDGETGLGDKEVSALWTLVPDTCNKRIMVSI
jgi:hypothetical protein